MHDQLVALDSSLAKDMFTGEVLNPTEWRNPPQYMDRDELKHYVKIMKADIKSEKQKLKKSHKFSAGKKRVGKRARGKYHKRDKRDKSRRRKKNKSKRRKRDKSKRRKKKTKFSAGNKIPATHEADKKLSILESAWRKASMDCFAENGKARRKVSKLVKKLRKCSRNLRLSQELLKANKKKKKSRMHKFRNGDGEKNPKTFMECWRKHVGFGPGKVVTGKNDAELRHCVWTANALRHAQQQLGKPPVEPHQQGEPPGKSSGR